MIKIELNKQEAQALIDLMDAGVKAVGLQSAKAAAVLGDKIFAAIEASKKDESNVVKMNEEEAG